MKTKRSMKRFMAQALAALLVLTTLGNDFMVANAEELMAEEVVVEDESAAVEETPAAEVEMPVWETIPETVDEATEEISEEEATEEVEEDEEEETEDAKSPAVTLTDSAAGITVTVDAPEGALPEGTTLSVSEISAPGMVEQIESLEENRNREVKGYVTFDVTLYDKEGNVIEPDANVKVSFTNINAGDLDDGKIVAYHSEDINAPVEKMAETNADNSAIAFSISSLSPVCLAFTDAIDYEGEIDKEQIAEKGSIIVTVRFINKLTGNTVATSKNIQVTETEEGSNTYAFEYDLSEDVKDGYTISVADGITLAGNKITKTYTEEAAQVVDVYYTAKDAQYKVNVYVPVKGQGVVDLEDATTYEKTTTTETGKVDSETTYAPEEKTGFVVDDFNQEIIKGDNSTEVNVTYSRVEYKVVYDTQGGSYIPAKKAYYGDAVKVYEHQDATAGSKTLVCGKEEHTHIKNGRKKCTEYNVLGYKWWSCGYNEEHKHSDACYKIVEGQDGIDLPVPPTRAGYTFAGWYEDAACTKVASKTIASMEDNVTVYAKWTASTANYTVVYQKENLDGSYSFISAKTKSANVGSTVTADNGAGSFTDSAYYHFNEGTSATVSATGNTVVYARYDLNTYKLEFDLNTYSNVKMTINGKEYTQNTTKYTITCKYGEDISAQWPTASNITGKTFYSWQINGSGTPFVSKRFEVTSDMLNSATNNSTTTYKAEWKSGTKVILHYKLENAEGSEYEDSAKYRQEAYTDNGFSAKDIYGFEYEKNSDKTETIGGVTNYYFYYKRNAYSIEYRYGTAKLTTKDNIKFEKNINTSEYNYTPSRPAGLDSEAYFAGWYDNENATGESYKFDKMPAGNLLLYAGWKLPEKTVTLVYNNGEANGSIKVVKNDYATIDTPVYEGYTFEGWVDADGKEFDINAPITADVTIYAKWNANQFTRYTVKYVVDGKELTDLTVTKNGKIGAQKKEEAKTLTGTYAGYIPDAYTKDITLVAAESANVITFNYTNPATIEYRVAFKYNGTEVTGIAGTSYVSSNGVINQTVYPTQEQVNALAAKGYSVNESFVQKTLTSNKEENVLVFTLKVKEFTISYENLQGADSSALPTKYTIENVQSEHGVMIPALSADGKVFLGWETGSNTVAKGSHVSGSFYLGKGTIGNLKFIAKWADAEGYTGEYDGQPHSVTTTGVSEGITVTYNGFTTAPTYTNVGEYPVSVRFTNAKDGWHVEKTVKVIITPKTVTINTPGDTKEYDGTPLTKEGTIAECVSGLIDKDVQYVSFATTGSQTEVGSSKNTYNFSFTDNDIAKNYNVVEGTLGDLVVTKIDAAVTVTTIGGTFEYDGDAHGATVTVAGLPEGYTYTATSNAKATHVAEGTKEAKCDSLVIKNAAGKVVTDKITSITYVNGSITITPAKLTVKTETDSKVYDGTALTAEGSVEGFKNDETATFTVTGSQTAVGTSDNTYVLTFDGIAVATDYTVDETVGKLTVTESADEIVVTTVGGEFTYDGQAHGATVTVSELPKGYTLETATSNDAATHVLDGVVTANCDTLVIKNAQGVNVTSKLNIKYVDGSIKINPATLTVVTETASKVYDGTALTADGSVTGYVNGEKATFTTTGTQTAVGESNNTYTLTFDGSAAETDYTVSETVGKLTVTESTAKITVTTTGGKFTYDGAEHKATVAVTGVPTGYRVETATSDDKATHVADGVVTANCDTLVIKNAAGEDVTSKLNIKYENDTIKITPATLTVVTGTDSKVYDGTALTKAGTIEGFKNNETATFEVTGSQTAVGSSSNTYKITYDGTAVETDYTVDETVGTLTVNEYAGEITVTTTGGTFTYDGKAHGATVEVSTLPTGYTLETATSDDTATHVAEGTVTANCDTLVIKNAQGVDVTSKLSITYVNDAIKITPATLTVATESGSKVYDGEALTATGTITGFKNNETATFATTGTQTEVGSSSNTYSLVFDKTAAESDYTVSETVGTLTVTESADEIVVTTTGGEFTYDGQAHGATVTVSELPKGYTLVEATSDDTATHVAEGTVTADCDTLVIKNAQGVDVTSSLNIRKVDGSIKINPATLTVVTPNASKEYDGTALTAEGSVTGFVNNETATFTTTGTQTAVGESNNTYTLTFDGSAVATDYEVSATVGKLTVTESTAEITVTTTGGTFEYDGKAHGATVAVTGVPTGYRVETATSDDKATHVADGVVTANCDTLVIKNAAGEDVTSKLNIKYENDTIKITPATLTVVTGTDSKVYDGTALTKAGTIEGFVNGETATFTVTGSQTEVGSSDNTYTLVFDGTAAEADYTVAKTVGTLTVNEYAGEITVTTTGGTFEYDGQVHGATVEVTGVPTGYSVETATSNDKATHVADGVVEANCDTLVIKNAQGVDVTTKLSITYVNDAIKITPATLTVATESGSKVYDGEALTATGTITGFKNNETATFATTGTQTEVGSSSNTYSLVFDKTAAESDYTVSETVGTLTVTESADEIVVTTVGGEFTYDGQAHGATVTVSELPTGYTLETATSNDAATHVADGVVTANCDTLVIKNAQGVNVTSKLNIKYVDGSIKIKPATLTVATPNAEKTYDGTALTALGTITGFKNNEIATFTTTGSQTAVGESDNTYTLTFDGSAAETDYTVSETVGTLTVTESTAEITVTTTGGEFIYDGAEHKATVEVTGVPTGYRVETATSDDKATHVEDGVVTANCDTLVIKNAQGVDVTSKLSITYVNDAIKITPATLTVATESGSKVYDGEALTKAGTIEGFKNNETATFAVTGSQTAVGTSDNTYTLTFDKSAVETDYTVRETVGTLTVNEYAGEITVTTTGGTFEYDGIAHGATVEVSTLPTGYTLETATSSASATHVTEGTVTATCDTLVIKNAAEEDVTAKLNIKKVDGSITITPATLTVATESGSKVYDGEALTATGTITGFKNNETATFATTGTQTEVGSSSNTYSLVFDKTAAESDYTVSETVGTLTVTESADEIVVTTTGGEFTYDGQAHGATVTVSELPKGYTLVEATSDDTATHVAEGTVTADCDTLVIKNAQGVDVTSSLNIRKVDGSIKIKPATLTVATPNAEKTYDGTALTALGTITGFKNNEIATFTTTGSQTAVGESNNTYTLTFDGSAVATDYTVSATVGKLTVTESTAEITVTTTGGTFEYDGQVHGATVEVTGVPTGYSVETATSNDKATHVEDEVVTANCDTLVIKNAEGEDVTSKLNIKYVDGSITITPATLTVTTPSDSKVYDGTALTAEGSVTGFVNNETASFTTTGSQTAVGTSDNTYTLTFDQSAAETDYTVSETIGTLTVNEYAGEITVTTTGGTFEYDGQTHGATVEVSKLPTGYTLVLATSNDKATHVAEGTVEANCDSLIIKNAQNIDVTDQLNIKYTNGTIKITPAKLTVVTETDSKVYDGEALTATGTIEGFKNNETATFTVTGSQTAVGTSDNTYTLVFDQSAAESDYTVDQTVGKLTVTESADEIVVTTTGGIFTYDGTEHKATVTVSTLPKGYTLEEATSNDVATHVADGTVAANCDTLVIKNVAGEDVTDKLNIIYVDGSITITPATLTVVTGTDSKVYDGTALTKAGTIEGFVNGEAASFEVTGSQTAVGSSDNTYALDFNKTAVATDYTVSATVGKLTVTESTAEITVTTAGGTFEYDGKAHGATVEVSTLPTGYTLVLATSDDKATHVAEGTVEANCDSLIIKNAQNIDVTDKLNITYVDGSITIIPAALTVVTGTDSKVYDGEALTAEGTIEGFKNNETATFTVTGSQTAVGTSDNTYTLVFDQSAAESDYTVNQTVGKLTVTESADEIVVTTTGGTFTYDGTEHKATVTVSTLPKGYTLEEATSNDVATHVADGKVEATCDTLVIKNAAGENVTSKLSIKYVNDTVEITPAVLTVVTPNAEKTYDGEALTAEGTISGFIGDETATFVTTGTQTEVGTSDNTYTLVFDQTAAESDYTVNEEVGTLTVTENDAEIVVTTIGGEFTYDGKAHKASVKVSDLPKGYTLDTAETYAEAIDVTETAVDADCDELVIKNAAGEDVTAKMNITYVPGTITVNPAPITLTIKGYEKVYDGTATEPEYNISGVVEGEEIGVTFKHIPVDVELDADGNPVDVEIEYELDWETPKPRLMKALMRLFAGPNTKAKSTNYTIDSTDVGRILITPATLTVTTESASKTYDGSALTASGSYEGLVGEEEISFTVTGTQTAVGSSVNSYDIFWLSAKEGNYTVVENLGTLTVNPVPVTPTGDPTPTPGPSDPTPTPGTTPTPNPTTPDGPDVLGVRRGVEADQGSVLGASRTKAVLGARRGAQTGDENAMVAYMMMMGISASFAGLYTIARRKKKSTAK